jgi:hypothetical protein
MRSTAEPASSRCDTSTGLGGDLRTSDCPIHIADHRNGVWTQLIANRSDFTCIDDSIRGANT